MQTNDMENSFKLSEGRRCCQPGVENALNRDSLTVDSDVGWQPQNNWLGHGFVSHFQ